MVEHIPLSVKFFNTAVNVPALGVALSIVDDYAAVSERPQRRRRSGVGEARRPAIAEDARIHIIIDTAPFAHGTSLVESVFFLRHDPFDDTVFVERNHICVEFDRVGTELSPIIIRRTIVVDEDRRVNPPARKPDGIQKRAFGTVGNRHALAVIAHAEIQIIFPVFIGAIGRKKQVTVGHEFAEVDHLRAQEFGNEPKRNVHFPQ